MFHAATVLTLGEALRTLRFSLWDEANGRLIRFADFDADEKAGRQF